MSSSEPSFFRSATGRAVIVSLALAACGAAAYLALTRSARGRFLVAARITGEHARATRELAVCVRDGLTRIDVDPGNFAAVPT